MKKILLFTCLIFVFQSCKEKTVYLNDLHVDKHGRISYLQTPKLFPKDCEASKTIPVMIRKMQEEGNEFKLECFLNGKQIYTTNGAFGGISKSGRIKRNSMVVDVPIPNFDKIGKIKSIVTTKLYLGGELKYTEEVDLIFLENGEIASFCEYGENQYRIKCGGNNFFEDSDLFAIPEAGTYDIDQRTKIHTYREPTGNFAMAISYTNGSIVGRDNGFEIPIPFIENDTLSFPKEFKAKEGIRYTSPLGHLSLDESYVGKYLTYGLEKMEVAKFKTIKVEDCQFVTTNENCLYGPRFMALSFKPYSGDVFNNYLSLK